MNNESAHFAVHEVILCRSSDDAVATHPSIDWAEEQLMRAFERRGIRSRQAAGGASFDVEPGFVLTLAGCGSAAARALAEQTGAALPEAAESFALLPDAGSAHPALLAAAPDAAGLMYAALELADRIVYADDPLAELAAASAQDERPANAVRAILRTFANETDDKAWFYDRGFWEAYLTELAAHRFNRLHLALGMGYDHGHDPGIRDNYFCFAYPFLTEVPGYGVRIRELPDGERERNLETIRFIGREAKRRNIHFQLGIWTQAYEMANSPEARYTVEGLTPELHAAYCRDALRLLLRDCPEVDGVTLRIHYESGIPEPAHLFWEVVFAGVADAGRPVQLDLHPKGLEHELLRTAVETGQPVTVSPKYWAEHMGLPYHQASIRESELPTPPSPEAGDKIITITSRRFTRYGYADFLREDREYGVFHRIWPGTQRVLLWGDPALAAGYGRHGGFCGSLGVELCEPLSFKSRKGSENDSGRDPYTAASSEAPLQDWEHYRYTYRLWGRLLYNPDADPVSWRRYLRREFGPAAEACERALACASRILPIVTTAHLPSASNNWFWPEMYANQPIVGGGEPVYRFDCPPPHTFGAVSPLDPALFYRIDDYAEDLVRGTRQGKYSPLEVAGWIESLAGQAEEHLRAAAAEADAAGASGPAGGLFRRWRTDTAALAGLGRFFAHKLRAGVAYALHERTGDRESLRAAIEQYRLARDRWKQVADATADSYAEDVTFGYVYLMRGHWADRLPAIEADLAAMERAYAAVQSAPEAPSQTAAALFGGAAERSAPGARLAHQPPSSFRPGEAVLLSASLSGETAGADASGERQLRLHYRRVNQEERFQAAEMRPDGSGAYRASIPGEYTDSPYPLQYFFELRGPDGSAAIEPGFDAEFSNLPYYVVRQHKA